MRKCLLLLSALFLLSSNFLKSQNIAPPLPQRTATVSVTQHLSFGDISVDGVSTGGTVTVDYSGQRTATSSVYLLSLGYPVGQAILEFHLCPGRSVKVMYDPIVMISNGSYSMSMNVNGIRVGNKAINASGESFVSNKGCSDTHYIQIGGVLNVGNLLANPPGEYVGTFNVTLAQE